MKKKKKEFKLHTPQTESEFVECLSNALPGDTINMTEALRNERQKQIKKTLTFKVHTPGFLAEIMTEALRNERQKQIKKTLTFKVHTPGLLAEIMSNPGTQLLKIPMSVFTRLLYAVANRASELNDPILNRLMCDLTLYEIADPYSKEFNQKAVRKIKAREQSMVRAKKTPAITTGDRL